MTRNIATERRTIGFVERLFTLLGLMRQDKQTICMTKVDRMAALDDPATRRALADLPQHVLKDIGIVQASPRKTLTVEGDDLRRHMW